jgi:hyperosmotically inducible protein
MMGTALAEYKPVISNQPMNVCGARMQFPVKIVAITAVTLLATGCNLMKGKETSGQYVDDATVSTRAKAALVKDSTVSATDFNIDVYKGNVTLTGVAKNAAEVNRAIDDIKRVDGVVSVKNATRLATAE